MEIESKEPGVKKQKLGWGYHILSYGLAITLLIGGGRLMKGLHPKSPSKLEKEVVEQTFQKRENSKPTWFYSNFEGKKSINYQMYQNP